MLIIEEKMKQLTDQEKEIFHLYYIEGYKIKEIAKMKNQKTKIVLISIMIFMMSTVMAFAEEVDIAQVNADKYGVLTLIPPIVAIVIAFFTINVVIA